MAITNKIGMRGFVALPSCKTLVHDNVLGSLSFWNLRIGENTTLWRRYGHQPLTISPFLPLPSQPTVQNITVIRGGNLNKTESCEHTLYPFFRWGGVGGTKYTCFLPHTNRNQGERDQCPWEFVVLTSSSDRYINSQFENIRSMELFSNFRSGDVTSEHMKVMFLKWPFMSSFYNK
jgi:hypothetical protein